MHRADLYPASDFDEWANSYDADVLAQSRFPFAGYALVLKTVFQAAAPTAGMTVLDIGTGTGNLAQLFSEAACRVWGLDFSEAMLTRARQKLPQATFVQHDLRALWPRALERRFDRIVSAYTLHHLELEGKVRLLVELSRQRLEPGGRMVIADVSFRTASEMEAFSVSMGDLWEEEPYWLADQALEALRSAGMRCTYEQVSACAGVYRYEQA